MSLFLRSHSITTLFDTFYKNKHLTKKFFKFWCDFAVYMIKKRKY